MTDRWRGVWVAGAFGVALVLLLHVAAGCGDGGRAPAADAAQDAPAAHEDAAGTTDSMCAPPGTAARLIDEDRS